MAESYEFLSSILDTITEHIVVINTKGDIQYVNRSWMMFGNNNDCAASQDWTSFNYLDVCDAAAKQGDEFGANAADGIRKVIRRELDSYYFEYPCNSPNETRWFMMRTTPFNHDGQDYFVISHQNITERKLAEEKVLNLSRIDGLTQVANRRFFDEFISNEWRRCARLNQPISLAILDVDHFKLLNDSYGHQHGDNCLRKLGKLLRKSAQRPSDICARYGGEEFALLFGNTPLAQAEQKISEIQQNILQLAIPNRDSPTAATVTASIGLATMSADARRTEINLIALADKLLYSAKESGRNRIVAKYCG